MRFGKLAGQDVGRMLRCRELFLASLILRTVKIFGGFAGVERSWRRIAGRHFMAAVTPSFRTVAAVASSRMRAACGRSCCDELIADRDRSLARLMR